ncbi:MAG: hypothetical protein NXI00_21340 [Cytophagales bacterium]|nr:hypothetical protein [Cytophagales bacterium]
MTENKEYIQNLHEDHTQWEKDLSFYEDQLKIFKSQLAEISSKNTSNEIKIEVEKFQNQFIIQKDEIDKLKHMIHVNEDEIEKEVLSNPVAVDHRKADDDTTLRERMEIFVPLFNKLKEDFREFAGKSY